MASQIGMTLFASVAFAGANKLFSLFDKNGALSEQKRHNEAIEAFSKAREKFEEDQVKRREEIAQKRAELQESRYSKKVALQDSEEIRQLLEVQEKEPQITDYYRPSNKFVRYSWLLMVLVGAGIGAVLVFIYKLVKRF